MSTTERLAFGEVLRRYRVAAGLTQQALAERAALSARRVQYLERGVLQVPYADTVRRLAEALGLDETDRTTLQAAARRPADDHSMVTTSAPAGLPTGLVTFLFTDVEGSTRLWQQYRERMGPALARHDELIQGLVAQHGGTLVRPRGEGDSRFAVFARASDAVAAACAIQVALIEESWALPEPVSVRMAVHTGEADLRQGDYYGPAVNHCARLRTAAHGGQVLVSTITADLVREALAAELTLRDLGEHQLKDLERPERIWQVLHTDLPADFPPLSAGSGRSNNLPQQLSSFIGHDQTITELLSLLAGSRLLTLTGPGGIGKTRIALRLASQVLVNYPDGVWLLRLDALADPVLVPAAIASVLDVREQPGRSLLDALTSALGARQLLVVLDNCEHLIQACAESAEVLLQACPRVQLLATSREPLSVAGERVWRVSSLSVPDPQEPPSVEQVARSEAGQLFVERAQAADCSFQMSERNASAVAEVCRRLDGIPLALELAAARVSTLSVEQIAARLDDALGMLVAGRRLAPARQQTVRATLDWSYELLGEPEQVLFERLSVFAGGWTLEAAEAIAGTDGVAQREVLPLLGRLVDTSIVVVEPGLEGQSRYRLLEALRQYSGERLAQRGSADAIYRQHAAYFLSLAEQTEPDLSSPSVMAAQARLEADHDNLRAALAWLLDQGDVDGSQRLAGALGRFWFFRGHVAEANAWLKRALALPGVDRPTAGRAKCLYGVTMLALGRGDYQAAERHAHETRALWHALGNAAQEAFALFHLGLAATRLGKYSDARAYLQAGLEISRAARHGGAEANSLFTLADLALDLGDNEEARGWAEAALTRATDIGQARQIAAARGFLGVLSTRQGDYSGAAVWLEASLATWRELGEVWWVAEALVRFGQLAIEQGDIATARTRLTESLKLAQELGDQHRTAAALEGFVQIAALEGRARLALQLAAAADALREIICVPLPPAERSQLERCCAEARRRLDQRTAKRARVEGRTLGMRQAIDLALTGTALPTVERTGKRGQSGLTAREQAVARLVAQGLTNRQIAERLVITEGTAERHVGNILGKLEMNARSQIAAWAVGQGLFAPQIPTDV